MQLGFGIHLGLGLAVDLPSALHPDQSVLIGNLLEQLVKEIPSHQLLVVRVEMLIAVVPLQVKLCQQKKNNT